MIKNMYTVEVNDAKTCFNEALLKAQIFPVLITLDGKPSAVIVSVENFKATEELKQQMRKNITLMRLF